MNLKSGTMRSTKRELPRVFRKGLRYRLIGDNHIKNECEGGVCNDAISCGKDRPDECVFEVACDPPQP